MDESVVSFDMIPAQRPEKFEVGFRQFCTKVVAHHAVALFPVGHRRRADAIAVYGRIAAILQPHVADTGIVQEGEHKGFMVAEQMYRFDPFQRDAQQYVQYGPRFISPVDIVADINHHGTGGFPGLEIRLYHGMHPLQQVRPTVNIADGVDARIRRNAVRAFFHPPRSEELRKHETFMPVHDGIIHHRHRRPRRSDRAIG